MDPLGHVSVIINTVPEGRGHATIAGQTVADESTSEVAMAATRVKDKLRKIAADHPEVAEQTWSWSKARSIIAQRSNPSGSH